MHKIALLPKAGVCPTAMIPDRNPSKIVLLVRNLLLISNLKLLIARPDLFIYSHYLVQILLSWNRLRTAFCSVTIFLVAFIWSPHTCPWAVLVCLRKSSSPSSPCGTPPWLLWFLSVLWGQGWPRGVPGSIPAETAAVPWALVLNLFPRGIRSTSPDAPQCLPAGFSSLSPGFITRLQLNFVSLSLTTLRHKAHSGISKLLIQPSHLSCFPPNKAGSWFGLRVPAI